MSAWPTLSGVMGELPDHLLRHIAGSPKATPDQAEAALAELMRRTCPWTTWAECALARERSVAGTSTPVPSCSVHGDPEPECDDCGAPVSEDHREGCPSDVGGPLGDVNRW